MPPSAGASQATGRGVGVRCDGLQSAAAAGGSVRDDPPEPRVRPVLEAAGSLSGLTSARRQRAQVQQRRTPSSPSYRISRRRRACAVRCYSRRPAGDSGGDRPVCAMPGTRRHPARRVRPEAPPHGHGGERAGATRPECRHAQGSLTAPPIVVVMTERRTPCRCRFRDRRQGLRAHAPCHAVVATGFGRRAGPGPRGPWSRWRPRRGVWRPPSDPPAAGRCWRRRRCTDRLTDHHGHDGGGEHAAFTQHDQEYGARRLLQASQTGDQDIALQRSSGRCPPTNREYDVMGEDSTRLSR